MRSDEHPPCPVLRAVAAGSPLGPLSEYALLAGGQFAVPRPFGHHPDHQAVVFVDHHRHLEQVRSFKNSDASKFNEAVRKTGFGVVQLDAWIKWEK